jgi:hypothetical protein
MIFYFIATRPYLEKAHAGVIFFTREEAEKKCAKYNDWSSNPGSWHVYQAKAINITEVSK